MTISINAYSRALGAASSPAANLAKQGRIGVNPDVDNSSRNIFVAFVLGIFQGIANLISRFGSGSREVGEFIRNSKNIYGALVTRGEATSVQVTLEDGRTLVLQEEDDPPAQPSAAGKQVRMAFLGETHSVVVENMSLNQIALNMQLDSAMHYNEYCEALGKKTIDHTPFFKMLDADWVHPDFMTSQVVLRQMQYALRDAPVPASQASLRDLLYETFHKVTGLQIAAAETATLPDNYPIIALRRQTIDCDGMAEFFETVVQHTRLPEFD